MTRRLAAASAAGVAVSAMLAAVPARASGVEHVVDDSAVETPGTCHVESWVTIIRRDNGVATVAPACTRRQWSNLELGGFVSTAWDGNTRETQIGIAPKWNLRDEKRGLGLALSGSAGIDVARGRLASASLIAPVTIPAGRLRFNLNIGWQWTRADGHAAIAGGQVEYQATSTLTLMAESFVRDHGHAGGQAGLRWNPKGGRIDFDLVYGRYVDGIAPRAVSLGLTIHH